jgi:hypothetical protein
MKTTSKKMNDDDLNEKSKIEDNLKKEDDLKKN